MINLEFLNEISLIFQTNTNVEDAFQAVFDILDKTLSFDYGTLFMYDKEKDRLTSLYQRGKVRVELAHEFEFQHGSGLSGWITGRREPLILPALTKARPGKDNLFRSFVSMPLWCKEELLGVLNLGHRKENVYSRKDIELFSLIASQIAMVIEKIKLQRELTEKNKVLEKALTELKLAQESLIEKERLAAIGEIVITVNHEINNPLTAIISLSEILQMTLETAKHEKIRSGLKGIIREARRIQRVTQKLTHLDNTRTTTYLGDSNMIELKD